MIPEQMEQVLSNVDRRVERIEQILPTLATKADLQAAIEPLATKAELRDTVTQFQAALDKAERRMRIHFDVVTESLRDDIQLLATALANLSRQDH